MKRHFFKGNVNLLRYKYYEIENWDFNLTNYSIIFPWGLIKPHSYSLIIAFENRLHSVLNNDLKFIKSMAELQIFLFYS